ncbi:MAG: hypothetical protein WED09_13810 [Homoserinimonas sp.]
MSTDEDPCLIDTMERLQPLAHISVLFDPHFPAPKLRPKPQLDVDYELRDTLRSALAALIFDGAAQVEVTADDGRLTVMRASSLSPSVLVRAWFPADGSPMEEFRLCHGTRRGGGPFASGGVEFYNSELTQLSEPVLDLAVAAFTAGDIDELPLPEPLRWRHADGKLLSRLHPSEPVHVDTATATRLRANIERMPHNANQ